jgi:hypothetical protein
MVLDFQSIQREISHYLNQEEKSNGKHGLKTSMIGKINKLKAHKLDFHTNQLYNLPKSQIHLLRVSPLLKMQSTQKVTKNGNNGPKI